MGEEKCWLFPHLADQLVEIVGRPLRVWIFCDAAMLFSKPYSALLTSSYSCFSLTFSMINRNCSWIWSIGWLYRSETRV